ncbi:MAG: hypothetical protein GEU94_00995 [Micromonosporaceae bacterium]|nr:hypothetical protein [Micromonosporaceae bacterium]
MSFQTSALILSWVAILLLALVVSGLVRQVHALSSGAGRSRPAGPPLGATAPGFEWLRPEPPAPMVLLFLDADCGVCAEVLDEAGRHRGMRWRALYRTAAPADAAPLGSDTPIPSYGHQAELFDRHDVIAAPYGVVVGADGRVLAAETVGSRAALRGLLSHVPDSAELGGP